VTWEVSESARRAADLYADGCSMLASGAAQIGRSVALTSRCALPGPLVWFLAVRPASRLLTRWDTGNPAVTGRRTVVAGGPARKCPAWVLCRPRRSAIVPVRMRRCRRTGTPRTGGGGHTERWPGTTLASAGGQEKAGSDRLAAKGGEGPW